MDIQLHNKSFAEFYNPVHPSNFCNFSLDATILQNLVDFCNLNYK